MNTIEQSDSPGRTVDTSGDLVAVVDARPAEKPSAGSEASPGAPGQRLVSLDAYRGFVMLLMASEGLGIAQAAAHFPGSAVWQFLAYQVEHVQWVGCSLWDLIQPSFMFMVGVAMPFSLASRQATGQSFGRMLRHALIRSLALIALGIFLRSEGKPQTYFTFEDVLTQIGLGYTFLFLLAFKPPKVQFAAAIAILGLWWLANVLYPTPAPGFDYNSVGVKPDWIHQTGIAAHFDKNTNIAAAADQWFLNIFPREKPFVYNGGGYQTLNFIPSLATMIFGLLAGGLLRRDIPAQQKVRTLLIAGVAGLVIGNLVGLLGICPVVKRIWSPSWSIYSTGWTLLLLAFFYYTLDVRGRKGWAFPLIVVGMNSIFIYTVSHLERGWIERTFRTHLGQNIFGMFGEAWVHMMQNATVLVVLWLACYWLYKRRIFLRI